MLATIGIGIGGAIPLSGNNKKDEFIEVKTEQIDIVDDENTEDKAFEIKP
ncbi:hypothetical protein [Carboxylicivirga sp. M1479]|nr:hypothetical protein [Carboxylicivirga sp. M1479]